MKEKAFEFVDKFRICKHERRLVSVKVANQCALIAIDEILKIVPSVYVTNDDEIHNGHYQYWKEMRQEIEKLS